MTKTITEQLAEISKDASVFAANVERYWNEEGVSQLEIFIDPELYKFIRQWHNESVAFAQRVAELKNLG